MRRPLPSVSYLAVRVCALSLLVLAVPAAGSPQARGGVPSPEAAATARKDPLGRDAPRGTVLGFLDAARRGDHMLASQYLDLREGDARANELARQLFVVLDARLPARLTAISDAPEGSRPNPLKPDEDVAATISTAEGPVDIVLTRVTRKGETPVWLFSRATLSAIPAAYDELQQRRDSTALQRLVNRTPLAHSRLLDWIVVLIAIAVFYFLTGLLNRIVTPAVGLLWKRVVGRRPDWTEGTLPRPARLLLMSLAGRWLLANLTLSLPVRQFWSGAATLVTIVSSVWLLILFNGQIEEYVRLRLPRTSMPAAASLVRLMRRGGDAIVIFAGLLAMLRLFAVDATPALAGLGVGGIAVALAAQKTLENVIAGASLIFDQAVRVGDTLRMGEFSGTVDHIGLRSTRIRTLDRTIVSIPNGQLANASLETLSDRDKFWFHPIVGLGYDTTPVQLHAVLEGVRNLLRAHPSVDPASVRARFVRLGAYSLDVEVFAYLVARDWAHFLELQEALLFSITEIVSQEGASIAFPSQTMYVATHGGPPGSRK